MSRLKNETERSSMGNSTGIVNLESINIKSIQEFYEWLQGKSCPKKLHFEEKLNLTAKEAFRVIYYLQEELKVFPDKYEKCLVCGWVYDSDYEGTTISEESSFEDEDGNEVFYDTNFEHGTYCDNCRPD